MKKKELICLASEKGYLVSDQGEVISPRGVSRKLGDNDGYSTFTISLPKSRTKYPVPVHLLQAYQMFGEDALEEHIQVRHLDGDRKNNCPDNISMGTPSDNQLDRSASDRQTHAIHASSHRKNAIPKDTLAALHIARENGATYSELEERFGLSKSTLSYHLSKNAKRQAIQTPP